MPQTAFISYSHESGDHKAWVLRLATDIRSSGVDAHLDRWHLRPGEEAGAFMARSVTNSNKVVVVCTETYVEKAEARVGGAGFESALVTAELVTDQGTAKFIPLLRANPTGRIPSYLAGRIYVDFRNDDDYEESLTTLLRAIHDLPALDPPPLGVAEFDSARAAPVTATDPPPSATSSNEAPMVQEVEELLQNPHRRIQLSKLLWSATEAVRAQLLQGGLYTLGDQPTDEAIAAKTRLADTATATLLPLLATMGRWASREQIPTAAQMVAHFLDIPEAQGSYYEANVHLARYPALLALYAAGLGALSAERLDNLRALLFVGVASHRRQEQDRPLVEALHRGAPFAQAFWKRLPGKDKRHTPLSDHALERLAENLPELLHPLTTAERLFDRLEGLVSLAYLDSTLDPDDHVWAPLGSFLWRDPTSIRRMNEDLKRLGAAWPPLEAGFCGGSTDRASSVLGQLERHLVLVRQQLGAF